jgi:hypothetical protein
VLRPDHHRQIATQPGYFISLGIASLVMILSSSGLRQRLFSEHSRHNLEPLRADVALATVEDAREERLPDLCVVCGKQTSDRVRKKLQYQSKKAQALMMLGFICGGIPGVIVAVLTQKETPISCPVCSRAPEPLEPPDSDGQHRLDPTGPDRRHRVPAGFSGHE